MRKEINFILGKNGGHTPSTLGDRSIVVIRKAGRQASRQADEILAVYNSLKFDNFNSKALLGYLNAFMVPKALYQ